MFDRRFVILAGLASAACASTRQSTGIADGRAITARLAAIEARTAGRIGVHIHDTASGRRIGYRDDEAFAFASTFKALLVGAILARVDRGELSLEQSVPVSGADIVYFSPVVETYVAAGSMTLAELCAAAIVNSDNASANLLLPFIGGPAGYTTYARSLGDDKTRLDRNETKLNTNLPGDPRDTTTPRAMADSLATILLGTALSAESRARLRRWMETSPTGKDRLRSGLPAGWTTADKTGTGMNGSANIIAVVTPPGGKPIVVAVYMTGSTLPVADLNTAHAEIGKLIAATFGSDA